MRSKGGARKKSQQGSMETLGDFETAGGKKEKVVDEEQGGVQKPLPV